MCNLILCTWSHLVELHRAIMTPGARNRAGAIALRKVKQMTTEIVVKANHGWPVQVTGVHPLTRETVAYGGTVPAGETRTFHCHSSMDLTIHEIQPNEVAPHSDKDGALGAAE